jgi:hypothetical protein
LWVLVRWKASLGTKFGLLSLVLLKLLADFSVSRWNLDTHRHDIFAPHLNVAAND